MASRLGEGEHTVLVLNRSYTVTVHQRAKNRFVAVGDYNGKRIEALDQSAGAALKRWRESAIYRGS